MFRALPSSLLVAFGAIALAAVVSCLLIGFGGVPFALGGPDSDASATREKSGLAHDLREKLAQPITLERGIDSNTPLQDALEFLGERYDFAIVVDHKAFAAIGLDKVGEISVHLPKLKNVPIEAVLRMLLSQVKGDTYSATFQMRDGHVEITTTLHQFMSTASMANSGRPNVPNVNLESHGQNLEEAFAYLADSTGINVIVDVRIRDKARRVKAPPLRDVPMDTAIRLMADMAELGVAITDNVFYVTDVENARVLRSEHEKWLSKFKPEEAPGALTPPMQ
jgi:hypothetical protein